MHKSERSVSMPLKKEPNYKGREQEKNKETGRSYKNSQKTINKMTVSTYLLIITLHVNGLSNPIKRHRETD